MREGVLRIRRLFLEHFAPILAGTGKEFINLDLSNVYNRMIIFIGPIGSAKTYIMSHLQPFATVGSLDIRNSDDPILEGKDGCKIIEYEKDEHEYIITHTYLWTGKTHTKKHSFVKDNVELNPNGNRNSFMDLVRLEFGIDESFLRLVRIGANVSNFISMKATERKSFIAALLKDTETYLYLYKCWSNDLRTLNTQVNILMNKITTFSKVPLSDLKANMEDLEDERQQIVAISDELKEKRATYKAEASTILGDLSIHQFFENIKSLKKEKETISIEIGANEKEMTSYQDLLSEKEINQKIGKADGDLAHAIEAIQATTEAYENCIRRYNQTLDRKRIQGDETHIATLRTQYNDMMKQMEDIEGSIKTNKCKYSTSQLESLLEDLNTMNMTISQVAQYDAQTISFVYSADSSIIGYANKKVEILNARKRKVQRLMSNLQFSEEYQPTQIMFLPPFCPTQTCPYYETHPVTIKRRDGGKKNLEPQLLNYQEELKGLDVEIYKYSDYPFIYNKIVTLREFWKNLSPILKDIGALKIYDLKKVITLSNYNAFYDYDRIIDTIDFVKKRNLYYELTESIKSIKSELSQFDIHKDESLDITIEKLTEEKDALEKKLADYELSKKKNQEVLVSLNDMYLRLSQKTQLQSEIDELKNRMQSITNQLSTMELQYTKLDDLSRLITEIDKKIVLQADTLKSITTKIDRIRTTINDISYTSKELDKLLQEQKWMTLMVDAVGSKKGIPMKMVKIFFDACRESINDMLYMVSGDDFEILNFNIGEKEFTIPYMVNGVAIDDISKASQGQTSLSSLALSFALVKELALRSASETCYYNIPLLDEPDSALHKSDKPKLLSILMKYLEDIQSHQCFIISHSEETFYGNDVQLVVTSSDEVINQDKYPNAIFI